MNWNDMDDDDLVRALRSVRPTPLSDAAQQRLEKALATDSEQEVQPADPARGVAAVDFAASRSGWSVRRIGLWAAVFILLGTLAGILVREFRVATTPSVAGRGPGEGAPPARSLSLVSDPAYQPEAVYRELLGARDEGVVAAVGAVPFRQVRYRMLDTYRWGHDQDGSLVEVQIPREEVFLLPVVTY